MDIANFQKLKREGVRGNVCNREHLLCTEVGFKRADGILLPVLRKLLFLTFNQIN
jgi:hypothetical protein